MVHKARRKIRERECEWCKKTYLPSGADRVRFCTQDCYRAWRKTVRAPNWAGGRIVDKRRGYVSLRMPGHPGANEAGRVLEHRWVMEQVIGRPLTSSETVHHINGNPSDNRPENLQIRQGQHGVGAAWRCCDCGSSNVRPVPLADPEAT